jgi:hypothetical protein
MGRKIANPSCLFVPSGTKYFYITYLTARRTVGKMLFYQYIVPNGTSLPYDSSTHVEASFASPRK